MNKLMLKRFDLNIRPIKTEQDYDAAMSRIEELWGAKKDTPEGDELDLLVTQVESYETKHYPINTKVLLPKKKKDNN